MKISVKINPNAKKTEFLGYETNLFGEKNMKIKIAAPPKEGRANKELIEFLAKYYKVPKSRIKILKGETSRNKIIEIK